MMTKIIIYSAAVMLLSAVQVRAQTPAFELDAITSYGIGAVAYEISAEDMFDSVRSRLEFPIDGIYGGVQGVYNTGKHLTGFQNISFGFKLISNLTDPDDDMNDFDWWNERLVGDTKSEAESETVQLEVFMRTDFVYRPDFILSGVAGFRYENYKFDIYGLDGYYLPPIGDGSRASLDYDIRVLNYEMTHKLFYCGLEGQVPLSDSVTAEGRAVMGIGFADDRDDHILRDKISTGEYITVTGEAAAYLIWYLSSADAAARFYIKGGLEAYVITGSGEQDQVFEDGSASFYGIDAELDMTLVTAAAMLGCAF